MQIRCIAGFFQFRETSAGEISRLNSFFGFDLVAKDDYFTFSFLKDAPEYAIVGGEYLGAEVSKTFEGEPWDVMRENEIVYDFLNDEMVPISSILRSVEIIPAGNYFVSQGLILPGSVTDGGLRVRDYAAWFSFEAMRFRYSEVFYV